MIIQNCFYLAMLLKFQLKGVATHSTYFHSSSFLVWFTLLFNYFVRLFKTSTFCSKFYFKMDTLYKLTVVTSVLLFLLQFGMKNWSKKNSLPFLIQVFNISNRALSWMLCLHNTKWKCWKMSKDHKNLWSWRRLLLNNNCVGK